MASNYEVREIESDEDSPPVVLPAPPLGGQYDTREDLKEAINKFTGPHGYAVTIRRSNTNRKGDIDTCYLECTRSSKPRKSKSNGKRNAKSQRIDCQFQAVGKLVEGSWTLKRINDDTHNHGGGGEATFSVLRDYKKTPEVLADIRAHRNKHVEPRKILALIEEKYGSGDVNKPSFKAADVWNEIGKMKAEKLGNKTPIQALNVHLQNSSNHWCRVELDPTTTEVLYLFWINKSSMTMLKSNGEVIILDATYKTNRYSMPLAVLSGTTNLKTGFRAGMCFMKGETARDYEWLFRTSLELFKHLDIPLPIVWITDGDTQIHTGLITVVPDAWHALCVWHIEQNVATNCKKFFNTNEAWQEFFGHKKGEKEDHKVGEFQRLIHASNEADFDLRWQELQTKYDAIDEGICSYLTDELIPKKQQWSKAWTDTKLHFNNHTTSLGEGGHAHLKADLKKSTGDLDDVVEVADQYCDHIRTQYINKLDEAKQRLDRTLGGKPLYRDLIAFITPHALREIDTQYKRLLEARAKGVNLPACTGVFRRTMGLPCAHDIETRLADASGGGVLKLQDVHPHWRFVKPKRHYVPPGEVVELSDDEAPPMDPLLRIQNPRKVKAKGRPAGAPNKPKEGRNRKVEQQQRSTQRDLSGFEHAALVDLTSEVQVPSSQPPPSQYTIVPPPPVQLYSRPMTEVSGNVMTSTAPSTAGRKRKANNSTPAGKKRIRKAS